LSNGIIEFTLDRPMCCTVTELKSRSPQECHESRLNLLTAALTLLI
jgi:hypothetical protein